MFFLLMCKCRSIIHISAPSPADTGVDCKELLLNAITLCQLFHLIREAHAFKPPDITCSSDCTVFLGPDLGPTSFHRVWSGDKVPSRVDSVKYMTTYFSYQRIIPYSIWFWFLKSPGKLLNIHKFRSTKSYWSLFPSVNSLKIKVYNVCIHYINSC